MSAHAPDVNGAIDAVAGRSLSGSANALSMAMMGVGVAAFAYGLFASAGGAMWAWGAYLVGLVIVIGLSLGGLVFSVIQTGTLARWGRPLKRLAETFAMFLPVAWLLLAVFLVFGLGIYGWHPSTWQPSGPVALAPHSLEAAASKELWLNPMSFVVRDLAVLGLLTVGAYFYVAASLRPDLIVAGQRLGARAPAWWARFTSGAGDVRSEVDASFRRQSRLVPMLGMGYMLGMSCLAFDLLMSLSPWWASNMFGAWISVSSFWVSCAAMAFAVTAGRDAFGLAGFVSTETTYYLGRLMLAGCMFWAYTTYAQLLPIWYTDMPEETDFLLVRMSLPEWSWLSQTVVVFCFLGPFTMLLSRGVKKMRWPFAAVAAVILVGIFLERSLLVMPQVWHAGTFPMVDFLVVYVGVWLGFLGLFVAVVGRIFATVPVIPVSDPQLVDHPWDVHVHAIGARAHH